MAKEKIRPSSLMLVDVDDLRELVQSEIEGVLAMEKDVNASEVYLTHKEVAKMLGVSTNTLWRWNKSGYLCNTKCGRKPFYKKSDIDKLMGNYENKTMY